MPQYPRNTYCRSQCPPQFGQTCRPNPAHCRPPRRPGLWPSPSPCPPQSQGGGKPGAPVWLAATLAGVGLMLLIICLPPCFWIAALGAAMVAAGVIIVVGKK